MRLATRLLLRPLRLDDIAQVIEIERESFPHHVAPTAYKRELEQNRLAHYLVAVERNEAFTPIPDADRSEHPGAVGRLFGEIRHILHAAEEPELPPLEERAEVVIGVVGVWLLPDEAHIVTIAVRESHRRRGIAELLLIRAIDLARAKEQGLVTLECRVTNRPALALYDKYGFRKVGLRPRYYSDNREDAYVLTLDYILTRRFREQFAEFKAEHERRWGRFDLEA